MALKIFNAENTVSTIGQRKPKEPTFRINVGGGLISISVKAAEIAGIQNGTQLEFGQDESMKSTWFFRTVKEKGITVKLRKVALCFNNAFLANEIIKSFPKSENIRSMILKVQEPAVKIGGTSYWRFEFLESKLKNGK